MADVSVSCHVDTSPSPRPDAWILKWIEIHRQSLVEELQNSVPAIADQMVQKGKIDPLQSEVYQTIICDTAVPVVKVRTFLEWLSSQPTAVFWTFQQALCDVGLPARTVQRLAISQSQLKELQALVDDMSVSEKVALTGGHSVMKVREQLQGFYRSRAKLVMSTGLAKGKTMSMSKVMVNICLLSQEDLRKAFEKPSFSTTNDEEHCHYLLSKVLESRFSHLSLEEVFKAKQTGAEEENPDNVLATGGAGCGKATCFTRKAPYEWAFGRLWNQFVLLFCLQMRDKSVWKAKTLVDLLKLAQLNLNGKEQEEVNRFILEHADQVLVICDGLDEGCVDESSMLWSILQGNCVGVPASLRLIVTTRPCEAAAQISRNSSFQGVEVVGFMKGDIELFTHRYLGEQKGKKLMSCLHNQPSVAGLMHAPLFCLMVCDLFKEGEELPTRRTEIFDKIMLALLQRYAIAHSFKSTFCSIANTPMEIRQLVTTLGKIAFEGLQSRQLYFTDIELDDAGVPAAPLELGFLSKSESDVFCKRDEFAFWHLALQEFLAALYVSSEVLKSKAELDTLLERVKFEDGRLNTFWIFLAGLVSWETAEALLSRLCQMTSAPGTRKYIRCLLCCCFAESLLGQSGTPLAEIDGFLSNRGLNMSFVTLPVSTCTAISTVMQAHSAVRSISLVNVGDCSVTDAGLAQLLPGLQHCRSLQTLGMSFNPVTMQHMLEVSTILTSNTPVLESLHMDYTLIGDDGLGDLSHGLKKCKKLKVLSLVNTCLTSKSGPTLCSIASSIPSLKELQLSANDLRDSGLEKLAEGLRHCSHLRKLSVESTGLSAQSVSTLTGLLPLLTTMTSLGLRGNEFGEDGNAEIISAVDVHPSLRSEEIHF